MFASNTFPLTSLIASSPPWSVWFDYRPPLFPLVPRTRGCPTFVWGHIPYSGVVANIKDQFKIKDHILGFKIISTTGKFHRRFGKIMITLLRLDIDVIITFITFIIAILRKIKEQQVMPRLMWSLSASSLVVRRQLATRPHDHLQLYIFFSIAIFGSTHVQLNMSTRPSSTLFHLQRTHYSFSAWEKDYSPHM